MFRNLSLILLSGVFAQLISIFSLPLIAKTYSPDEFGELYIITFISGMLGMIVNLTSANFLVKFSSILAKKYFYTTISVLSVFLSIPLGFLTSVILIKIYNIDFPSLQCSAYFIALAFIQLTRQFYISKQKFFLVSSVVIGTPVAILACRLLKMGLFESIVIANALFALLYLYFSLRENNFNTIQRKRLWRLIKAMVAKVAYNFSQNILNRVSQSMGLLFIASIMTIEDYGKFGLGYALIMGPGTILVNGLGEVLNVRYQSLTKKSRMQLLTKSTFFALIGTVALAFLYVIIPWTTLIALILNNAWLGLENYIQYFILQLSGALIARSSTSILFIEGKNKLIMYSEIFSTTLKFLAIIIAYMFFSENVVNCLIVIYTSIFLGYMAYPVIGYRCVKKF